MKYILLESYINHDFITGAIIEVSERGWDRPKWVSSLCNTDCRVGDIIHSVESFHERETKGNIGSFGLSTYFDLASWCKWCISSIILSWHWVEKSVSKGEFKSADLGCNGRADIVVDTWGIVGSVAWKAWNSLCKVSNYFCIGCIGEIDSVDLVVEVSSGGFVGQEVEVVVLSDISEVDGPVGGSCVVVVEAWGGWIVSGSDKLGVNATDK